MILAELQPFLDAWASAWAPVPATATPAQRRAHFERLAARLRLPAPDGITTQEFWISVPENGPPVRVLAFLPQAPAPRPALLYMHGGAFMQGSPETHFDITAALADRCRAVVVSVDYALAPERPFPQALNDCAAALHWCRAEGGARLGIAADRIAVGGDSAGANLAAALTLRLRDTQAAPRAQLLIYPGVEFRFDRPSHRQNADGPIIRVADMPQVAAAYCPRPEDRRNPLAAPLLAASHAGLPPAYVAVAEYDPLRDEGIAYAQALAAAGVKVQTDEGTGLVHGYLRALPWSATARAKLLAMADWLRARLA
ncbi:MAG: alpha/beta hydrolase [Burkholderiaceae bacterium]|nr:alpha/beta hydrolase [Burkholderiaceae bacterium]